MEKIKKLVMKGVTRRFGTTTALHQFDLDITGKQFISLLGPSGCGKSTALNCLSGLLELSDGEILLNDRPIQDLPAEKRGFGMVFQNYALFPHLSVERNVSYGLELRRVARAERERRVRDALELVHLANLGKRYPAQLSGGQQQRLAIARTIVLEPALLLLDEPLSNLDANLRSEMRIEIKNLHEQLGLTTVYVTHDQSEAMSLSDRVVVMRDGHIEQNDTPQEIYNRPTSLFVASFMGYVNRLSVTIVKRDGNIWQVRTTHGSELQAIATCKESADWQPGQSVLACCRPEDTLADPLPSYNRMQGQVQLVEYLGKSFEALLSLRGEQQEERLLVHSASAPEHGSLLDFAIQPERLLLFPSDEAGTETGAYRAMNGRASAVKVER